MSRRGPVRLVVALCCLFLAASPLAPVPAVYAAPPEGFAHPAIRDRWTSEDGAVAAGRVKRAWMWGPGPFYTQYEPFTDGPEGNHLVQYFDKARLEVNDPDADPDSEWFVTSGLLVKEMISGKAEVGNGETLDIGPARVAVTGDHPSGSPTYAQFDTTRQSDLTGKRVGCWFNSQGVIREVDRPMVRYEQASGHNWAEPFWRYASQELGDRWLYVLGYPITEPCGITTTIAGKQQTVLAQLFERRVLTYNPANPPATQVEMGNVGRHYFNWRYGKLTEANLEAEYNVNIGVGQAPTRLLDVEMTLALTNATPRPLDRIVLRAVWNHWDGVFTLKSAEVDGKAAQVKWLHGVNLELSPVTPVPEGKRATLTLRFTVKPRPVGGRSGYDRTNDILSLGDMLPTLVPWENGGWLYYPYSQLGDHGFYASSSYSVALRSSGGERLVVGGTGRVISTNEAGTEWRFGAENVRDVAYFISPRFIDPLKDASMTRTVGNTKMLAYFTSAHRAAGQRQLGLTAPALAWFAEKFGPYPFDSYTVAEMGVPQNSFDNYAQEYPMTYSIPSQWLSLGTSPPSWTWYIPVHEVGHQWFYSLIGNNQLADPWLDEALTTYTTAEYVRDKFPEHYREAWNSMSGGADRSRPVSSGVFTGFRSEQHYTAVVYAAGSQMLDHVRTAMGDARFYAALRDYFSQARFKRATPFQLISIFQKHSEADLAPIFSEYLGY